MDNLPVNEWVLRRRRLPNTCWENGMTYDRAVGRIVWFGGHIGHLYPQSNYTLVYDVEQDRFFDSQSPLRPQRRCLVFIAYADSCRRSISAAHGGPSHGSIPEGAFDKEYRQVARETMPGPALYDAAEDRWENCRVLPPLWKPRTFAPVCYEPNCDALLYIGGPELWLFCPRTNRLHTRPLPEALQERKAQAWAADPASGRVVLFGGLAGQTWGPQAKKREEILRDDTWIYEPARDQWRQCAPDRHPPRGAPQADSLVLPMVYHGASGTMLLLVNGTDDGGEPEKWGPAELWSFDLKTEQWSPVETRNGPSFAGLLAWAERQDALVLFGGGRDGTYRENPGKPVRVRPAHSREIRVCRVRVPGRKPVPAPDPERLTVVTRPGSVLVTWAARAGARYDVFRAQADPFPGPVKKVNARPVAGGRYVHRNPGPGLVYAYQVAAAGAARRSLPAFNQPWRPAGPRVSVESADRAVLRWAANCEPDLAGYHVYRARGAEVEQAAGTRLTREPVAATRFEDAAPGLGDGVARAYWVTAVNRGGVESGASPLGYTVPDAPAGLSVPEGVGPSNIDGEKLSYVVDWDWPEEVTVAGFNVYHATEVINTYYYPGGWGHNRWEQHFEKLNGGPVTATEWVYLIPKYSPPDHYFVVRAVNVLGQEGFYSDIVSPTDRRFRPSIP
jgi:hypothetical protein